MPWCSGDAREGVPEHPSFTLRRGMAMETQEFDCPNVLETQTSARSRDVPVGQFGDFLRRLPIAPLVRQGSQCDPVRPARPGKESPGGSTRLHPCRKWLARPVHANHRPRPAAANRPPRTRSRIRHRQARQIPPADPRRPRLVTKDQAETSVLFELIGARYERRSLLVTANQPFGERGKIFPDQAMTLAVVDRLVHHATIFEMNVESYRRRAALERKRGPGRPPVHATVKTAT